MHLNLSTTTTTNMTLSLMIEHVKVRWDVVPTAEKMIYTCHFISLNFSYHFNTCPSTDVQPSRNYLLIDCKIILTFCFYIFLFVLAGNPTSLRYHGRIRLAFSKLFFSFHISRYGIAPLQVNCRCIWWIESRLWRICSLLWFFKSRLQEINGSNWFLMPLFTCAFSV